MIQTKEFYDTTLWFMYVEHFHMLMIIYWFYFSRTCLHPPRPQQLLGHADAMHLAPAASFVAKKGPVSISRVNKSLLSFLCAAKSDVVPKHIMNAWAFQASSLLLLLLCLLGTATFMSEWGVLIQWSYRMSIRHLTMHLNKRQLQLSQQKAVMQTPVVDVGVQRQRNELGSGFHYPIAETHIFITSLEFFVSMWIFLPSSIIKIST